MATVSPAYLDEFDPFDRSPVRDVTAIYRDFRQQKPVHELTQGLFLVSRHRDVKAAALNWELFSSRNNNNLNTGEQVPEMLTSSDPPFHKELRRIHLESFTRKAMAEAEPWIMEKAFSLLDAIEPQGQADLLSKLALPLTNFVIARLTGIPDEDADQVGAWAIDVTSHVPLRKLDLESWQSLSAYLCHLVAARREAGAGSDSLIDHLIRSEIDGKPLSDAELAAHTYQLLVGGIETTAHTIGFIIFEMLRNPVLWQSLVSDPRLASAAIEEGVRFGSPLRHMFRTVVRDTELGGVPLPAGSRVMLSLESANHDEEVFVDPASFIPGRENASAHLGFGWGIHMCIGATLSRLEMRAMLQSLIERLPNLRLAVDASDVRISHAMVNGLQRVDVAWHR